MTLVFVSNYINHHQLPFCDACHLQLDDFVFIQSIPMEEERVKMGWGNDGEKRPYVRFLYKDERLLDLIVDCDMLLAGWSGEARVEAAIKKRLNAGKPAFRMSERIYKSGRWKVLSPRGMVHRFLEYIRYRQHRYYLLCAGAHVAGDFQLLRAFPDKKYRWGYFPKTYHYGDELWQKKEAADVIRICWSGRFIHWKYPEFMLRLARDLRDAGYSFHLDMLGSGAMESRLLDFSHEYGIEELVSFHGPQTPEYVRKVMEESHVFVLSSDELEGWGVVLNEAMNSGLAAVASAQAGASCYLIENGKNGFYYEKGSYQEMYLMVKELLDKPELRKKLARNAYRTIVDLWNAEEAASRLLRVCQDVLDGKEIVPAVSGPVSKESK